MSDLFYSSYNSNSWKTYTPTVTLGGAGTVPQYSQNTGQYMKFGNLIFVQVYLLGDGGNEGSGAGQIEIAIPVAASSTYPGNSITCGTVTNGTGIRNVGCAIATGASKTTLRFFETATTFVDLTGADQNNTTRAIRLNFFYMS